MKIKRKRKRRFPLLNSAKKCKKCKHPADNALMRYWWDGDLGEFIERKCLKCGYRWNEATDDS